MMKELDRILGILLALQSGRGTSASEVAARFSVSSRTICCDLRTMSLLGIPVYTERGRNGDIRLLEGYFLPPLKFSRSEAIALLLGVIMPRTLRSAPFQAEADTAAQKLLAAVPEYLRTTLTRLERIIGAEIAPSDIFHAEPDERSFTTTEARDGATVTQFLQALLNGNAIRLSYLSPFREPAMTLDAHPLGLFWDRGRWYLAGAVPDSRRTQRLWRADRVIRLSAAGQMDMTHADFDIGELLGYAWLKTAMDTWRERSPVRLRISSEQAQRLQRDWH